VGKVAAAGPGGDTDLRQLLSEPCTVAGFEFVARDEQVAHSAGADRCHAGFSAVGHLLGGGVDDFPPVR